MTLGLSERQPIEIIKSDLDHGYELSKLRRDNALRHSRGWVSSLVDFILLGLPIVAPIPNLINLRIALAPVMGWWASTIAAVAFELLLFGSAEIILYLQDKQMRNGGYENALKVAVGCGVAFIAILLTLIGWYEVPLHGVAVLTLPFVSVISIAFLSLKRWADIRESIESTRKSKAAEENAEIVRLIDLSERLTERIRTLETEQQSNAAAERSEHERLQSELVAAKAETERSTRENERLIGIISEQQSKLSSVREDAARMRGELSANRSDGRSENRSGKRNRTRSNKQESMQKVLSFFSKNPMGSLADAASDVGKSKTTVSEYLKEMESAGLIHRNGNGVEVV